ncbi:MAG: phospholipase D-like domain-containing protein [Acidimicrobiales bacterium]
MAPSPQCRRRRWITAAASGAVVATLTAGAVPAGPGVITSTPMPAPNGPSAGALRTVVEPGEADRSVAALIAGARRTIDLTMYELDDPLIQSLLVGAHDRGVAVRILLDRADAGSSVNRAAFGQLQAAGVPVRWASFSVVLHQKTLTVDGYVSALMTGNLVASDGPTTRDFVVFDRQPDAVSAVEAVFAADWAGVPVGPGPDVAGLVWSPGAGPALCALLSSARRTLAVENEEMDAPSIETALEADARRGVDVDVVMTADPGWDKALAGLTAAGVHVATEPESPGTLFLHAKAVVVDDDTVEVGSQNFSSASLDRNRELAVVTDDPAVVGPVSSTLAADYAAATPLGAGSEER